MSVSVWLGWSVCHKVLKGREVTLSCSYANLLQVHIKKNLHLIECPLTCASFMQMMYTFTWFRWIVTLKGQTDEESHLRKSTQITSKVRKYFLASKRDV